MQIKYTLFLFCFSLILNSCSYGVLKLDKNKCHFDKENLSASCLCSKDTILFYKDIGFSQAFHFFNYNMVGPVREYYLDVTKDKILSETFSISNIGCKDTVWANKMIKSELQRKCPFDYFFTDTFCIRKYYNVKLIDSSLLVKSNFMNEDLSGSFSGDKRDWIIVHGLEFKNIERYVKPNFFIKENNDPCSSNIGYMLDSLTGRFDIKIYPNVYELIGEDEHIKMVRDSLGFEVTKVNEEVIKYRKITYMKKKE